MTIPLVYVSGPFRGATPLDVRRNVEAARDVGLRVAQAGAFPIIPHCLTGEFDKQLTEEFWIDGHMELLRRCDAILLMNRWRRSIGAQEEYDDAKIRGMVIFNEEDGDDCFMLLKVWAYAWRANRSTRSAVQA